MKNIFVSAGIKSFFGNKQKDISYSRIEKKFLNFENLAKKLLIGSFACLIPAILVSCHNGEKRDFIHRDDKTVHCDTDMKFCLDTVDGDWHKISYRAIEEVNNNSAFSFTIVSGSDGLHASKFFIYDSIDGVNAYNEVMHYVGSRNIRNDIYYNTHYMGGFPYEAKLTIALHEMGHTLGLIDIPDERARNYSVMFYSFSNKKSPVFDAYPEYDRKNISWYYGGVWK